MKNTPDPVRLVGEATLLYFRLQRYAEQAADQRHSVRFLRAYFKAEWRLLRRVQNVIGKPK